ncbi:TetR/AcrR family transcriptional regulator [Pseudokineococcus sp. 1T1Z-3]|uniref:TetR/AcrR family transcriptional regulator n=1 Tax=Pseudokineococcus sp. 1T1Z-3 TaxID=3132745 RepID=UPI0030AC7B49
MREWVPVRTSTRGRLVLAALNAFGDTAYDDVAVTELAGAAQVTTGALYHHFGSKLGLYEVVRADVEQRVLDRFEAAAAAAGEDRPPARAALLAGFDFAVREHFLRLMAAPPGTAASHRLGVGLAQACGVDEPVGRLLLAAWREALLAVAEGTDAAAARRALTAIEVGADASGEHPGGPLDGQPGGQPDERGR